jgi:hypothetical protein
LINKTIDGSVVWEKLTDVSEVLAASLIRAMMALP